MKKQITSLQLKRQTISALDATMIKGGAPTTMTMITRDPGCPKPFPTGPLPESVDSSCLTMVQYCG